MTNLALTQVFRTKSCKLAIACTHARLPSYQGGFSQRRALNPGHSGGGSKEKAKPLRW